MILGFIGVGKISLSVITGISNSDLKYSKIILSPRNKKNSIYLKKRYKKIVDEESNAGSNEGSNENSNYNSNENPESYSGLRKYRENN